MSGSLSSGKKRGLDAMRELFATAMGFPPERVPAELVHYKQAVSNATLQFALKT